MSANNISSLIGLSVSHTAPLTSYFNSSLLFGGTTLDTGDYKKLGMILNFDQKQSLYLLLYFDVHYLGLIRL